jgi:hypothetical protein
MKTVGYNLIDELAQRVRDFLTHTPYWILFAVGLLVIVLFVFGLVRKMIVTTVCIAVIALVLAGLWAYSGHVLA